MVVGFGAFREGLERLAHDLAAGDLDAVARHARRERARAEATCALVPRRRRRRGLRGPPRGCPSASCGRDGSSTTSSPTCCPPARRWSCRARSRRRSGWSPPRPPPAARCPWWRATPGSPRSPRRSPRPSRRPRAAAAVLRARPRRGAELAAAVAGWLEAPEALRAADARGAGAITRERYSWEGVARTRAGRRAGAPRRAARPLNRYDSAPMTRGTGLAVAAAAALLVGASGCELKDDGDNLVAGKQAFVAKCGSCHVLKRAGTTGVTGPNLDEAFQQALGDGFGQSTFEGVVHRQILQPARTDADRPEDRQADRGDAGQDLHGRGRAGRRRLRRQRRRQAGRGQGPARRPPASSAPTRSRRPRAASSRSPPTPPAASPTRSPRPRRPPARSRSTPRTSPRSTTTSRSRAAASTRRAPVVKNGGVSKVSADVKAGEYTFFCSVPGHREGGMEGKLTVK